MGSVDTWQLASPIYRAAGVTLSAGDAFAADPAGQGLLLGRLGSTRAHCSSIARLCPPKALWGV
jgi:hypothetical protein